METTNIPWNAISARLENMAAGEDIRQIKEWLDLSPENPLILNEIVNTWSLTRNKPDYFQPDMSYNWDKLIQKIQVHTNKKRNLHRFLASVAAAAILVMVFLAGVTFSDSFIHQTKPISYSKIISPKGNKTQVVLPDSSKVWLNSGAELWYPSNYSASNREVWFRGECFFQVEKDPKHPMMVHGSKLQVKVYGTSFNMKEDDARDLTDVTLVNGKVEVLNNQNENITDLLPGQELVFSNGIGKVRVAENMEALTSWIHNVLIFKNQPFEEVIYYLSGWYGVNIQLDQSIYYHHNYTFKVKTESLREVLELISIITPIEYNIEGEQVKIKYKPQVKS